MKPSLKRSLIAGVIVLAASSSTLASADSLQLGSYATLNPSLGDVNTAMNFAGFNSSSQTPSAGTGPTYFLDPDTVWDPALANSTWVGYLPTAGPVGTVNPPFGYYTFTTTFTAGSTGLYSGSLSLMTDDTAEVLLNGAVIIPMGSLGNDSHCASAPPNCLAADTVSLSGLSLLSGLDANTLTFVVQQAGNGPPGGVGDPSGVDFDATLTSVATPEPGSLLLLGTGLFGITGLMFNRIRLKQSSGVAKF